MKLLCAIIMALVLVAVALPAMATVNIVHTPILVYQAYPGISGPSLEEPFNLNNIQAGLSTAAPVDAIKAVPGILAINPGFTFVPPVPPATVGTYVPNWNNFVSAFAAGVPFTIKNIILRKVAPTVIECADVFTSGLKATQQGTPNIRLWWPLLYEVPGTTYTLTITYGTAPWADPANPGRPSVVHTEVWTWTVDVTVDSMEELLDVFHEFPFGLDEVPLISDEVLYAALYEKLENIEALIIAGDLPTAGDVLVDFEMVVSDACITTSPVRPIPTGGDTGIANDLDNPACCKLLVDAEKLGAKLGIWAPSK